MIKTVASLKALLSHGSEYISEASELELSQELAPRKWSKKEILGHLIDSAINNLQRFTEIQFENKVYKLRPYSQRGLVNANDYQNSETKELVELWLALNRRIIYVMKLQNEKTLTYKVEIEKGNISDLKFLMGDYVKHLEHHVNQIVN